MTSTDRGRLITAPFALVTLSTFAYFLAIGSLLPTLPRFVENELGGGSVAVGFVVGAFAIAAAVLRPFPGRFGDLRGRRITPVLSDVRRLRSRPESVYAELTRQ